MDYTNWLTDKYQDKPQAWLLKAQVLKRRSEFEPALRCFQRTIDRDPNSVLAHVEMAEIYQFEFGDLNRALSHLDVAFTTGEHDPLLVARLLSVNVLLDRREDVGGLLAALEQVPGAVRDEITRKFVADVKAFLGRFAWRRDDRGVASQSPGCVGGGEEEKPSGPAPDPEPREPRQEPGGDAPTSMVPARSGADSPPASGRAAQDDSGVSNKPFVNILETAICFNEGNTLPMMGCRAYLTSEMFAVDFYDRSEGEDYAEKFGRCFAKFSRQIVVKFGNLHLRNSMLGMARCVHCGFVTLSNRSEDENLLCRMCDKKGPVVFDRSSESSALVAACESRAGLTRTPVGGTPVLLSFWVPPGEATEIVRRLCEDEGWRFVGNDTLSPQFATFLGHYIGARSSEEPSLQMIRELPAGEELYEGTEWSVQRVVLAVHARVGRYPSTSIMLPKGSTIYLEPNREKMRELIRGYLEQRLEDPEELARLIELVVQDDISRAGELVAFSRQLTKPNRDHPRLLAARGVYALRTGDTEVARQSLEEAKRRSPRDPWIRFSLAELWKALGMDDKFREEIDELRAIGFRLMP